MEFLIGLLGQFFDDPEHLRWAIYVVAAIVGITLAISLSYLISGIYSPIRNRLKKIQGKDDYSSGQDVTTTLEHGIASISKKPFLNFSNTETRRLLIHAGFHSENALALFNAFKIMLILLSVLGFILILNLFSD